MTRSLGYLILLVVSSALVTISVSRPDFLGDQNTFLKEFINHEFLNILGVILAITLASVANVHLVFNGIEEKYKTRGGLQKSRMNLKKSAYWLIFLFIAGAILVVIKPLVCNTPLSNAIFNSIALVILLWHVLILIGLTQLVFQIEPEFPEDEDK
jgi:hypothetical protein